MYRSNTLKITASSFPVICALCSAAYLIIRNMAGGDDFYDYTGLFAYGQLFLTALCGLFLIFAMIYRRPDFLQLFIVFSVLIVILQIFPIFCYFIFNGYNNVPFLGESIGITARWTYALPHIAVMLWGAAVLIIVKLKA
ncbi:MAG: hypothetical protein LBS19_06195 [Clostridiales bacterium]|jgi:hypothetical protein|nr:hypothetical protein [Clostridiales bacterium]